MQFDIDITKRLRCGGDEFTLRSRFSTEARSLVLFGPSGSGKTLTLKAIAGILSPDEGHIRCNGRTLFNSKRGTNIPARKRHLGYVFQDYALFPHLTVRENIGFGLAPLFRRPTRQQQNRISELVEAFGLESVAGQKPSALSGGQQQRAALARALATSPGLLLLDEPFSALDQPLRLRMRKELSRVLDAFDTPMVMVTHDCEDMESFAESIALYRNGSVREVISAQTYANKDADLGEMLRQRAQEAYE
jgi:molybdate transport system ATP-binding protein